MRAIISGGTPATLQSSACCSTPACFTPIISPESQSLDDISISLQEPLSFQCPRGISILVPSQFLESCHSLPFRHPSALLHFMHLRSNRQDYEHGTRLVLQAIDNAAELGVEVTWYQTIWKILGVMKLTRNAIWGMLHQDFRTSDMHLRTKV